jgi:hypothetical protein
MDPTPPLKGTGHPLSTVLIKRFIMEINLLGIDLAKRVFQLHGADRRGHLLHRAKVSRAVLVDTVWQLRPRVIAM